MNEHADRQGKPAETADPGWQNGRVAILGGGNIGLALAHGLVAAGLYTADRIIVTRRQAFFLERIRREGFSVTTDNREAVRCAGIVIVAVQPQQLEDLLEEIRNDCAPATTLVISVVSGVGISDVRRHLPAGIAIIRAMPNTAIAIRESMTCLAADRESSQALSAACALFEAVGRTLVIPEEHMTPATALCACGIAFFLRSIRAASQGGTEIGFHPHEALLLAAQTAKGAASLLLAAPGHPESEIDKVTTPRGCTIAGLNRMEHEGFSSAMIKGITTSAAKASRLYVRHREEGTSAGEPHGRRKGR